MPESRGGSAPPDVAIVVAVYNEIATIEGKLRELSALGRGRVAIECIVVDGGSSDGTDAVILAHAQRDARFTALLTPRANKIAQLNEALARVRAPWVLVTDADARMPPDTLDALLAAARDPNVGVVGTPVVPSRPHALDGWHWRLSNWIRRVERRTGGATGLAVAPCYLFRRDLIDAFPADVVADDVYVVCRAAEQGARTTLAGSEVVELRAAADLYGWYRHKVRRTLGYLREVLRVAPALRTMAGPMRAVLLWRLLALTVAPSMGLVVSVTAAYLTGIPLLAAAVLLLAAGAGRSLDKERRPPVLAAVALPAWTFVIMLTALILYPFVRLTATYDRARLRVSDVGALT